MIRKHWLLFSALVISGILVGEFIARYGLGLGTPPLSITHPTIEYMFKTNQDVYRFHNRILVNSYGMRTEEFDFDKSPDELRVMVFGDSVLNGGSLTDHSQLATTLLQKYATLATEKKVIVGNISAGSWGPGNWLAYANEYGFFDADIVSLVISSHDYADDRTFEPLNKYTHPWETPPSALLEGVQRYLPRYLPKTEGQNVSSDAEEIAVEVVEKVLGELSDFLSLAKSQALVIVFHHWDREEIKNGVASAGALQIARICEKLNVPFVSLRPYFSGSIQIGQNPYRDNIHPNELGQKLIAEAMAENFDSSSIWKLTHRGE